MKKFRPIHFIILAAILTAPSYFYFYTTKTRQLDLSTDTIPPNFSGTIRVFHIEADQITLNGDADDEELELLAGLRDEK